MTCRKPTMAAKLKHRFQIPLTAEKADETLHFSVMKAQTSMKLTRGSGIRAVGRNKIMLYHLLFFAVSLLVTDKWSLIVLCGADEEGQEEPTKRRTTSQSSFASYPLIPHHVIVERETKRRKRRRMNEGRSLLKQKNEDDDDNDTQFVTALYQGIGTHYVDLWCGTPIPQRQTVIVDTYTATTVFPCSDCNDNHYSCGDKTMHQIDNLYQQNRSSTFRRYECVFDEHNGNDDISNKYEKKSSKSCQSQNAFCRHDGSGGNGSSYCTIDYQGCDGICWRAIKSMDKCYLGGTHSYEPTASKNDEDYFDNDRTVMEAAENTLDPNHAKSLAFDLDFGCQTKVYGPFRTQLADGILGMNNLQDGSPFWSQMFQAGKIPGNKKRFALCFSRKPWTDPNLRHGIEAGALTLGGFDTRLHLSDMVFSTNATISSSRHTKSQYNVAVRNIYLRHGSGGESAVRSFPNPVAEVVRLNVSQEALNVGGIVVDSGTTDTWWNRGIADSFKIAFRSIVGFDFDTSFSDLTPRDLEAMPTILFQFVAEPGANDHVLNKKSDAESGLIGILDPEHPDDVLFAFPPSHYLDYNEETNGYRMGFSVSEYGSSTLGANAMMGHDILFDIENNRLGWAESSCDYTKLLHGNGYELAVDTSGCGEDEKKTGDDDKARGSKFREGRDSAKHSTPLRIEQQDDGHFASPFHVLGVLVASVTVMVLYGRSSTAEGAQKRRELFKAKEIEMMPSVFSSSSYRDEPSY